MISKFRQPGNRRPYPGGKGIMRFADLGGPRCDGRRVRIQQEHTDANRTRTLAKRAAQQRVIEPDQP